MATMLRLIAQMGVEVTLDGADGLVLDSRGWTCLLGPSGVGKSTMQAMVYASVALLIANFILTMILNSIFPMGFMR